MKNQKSQVKSWFVSLLLFSCISGIIISESACTNQVTLQKGGAYTDATLAVTDQAILDASKTMTGFIDWYNGNKTILDKYPEVGKLASQVSSKKDGWIKDAYSARDTYGVAALAYKQGTGTQDQVYATHAKINAALDVINNILAQINSTKTAHATS